MTRDRSRFAVVSILVVCFAGLLVIWFLRTFEQVEEEFDVGFKGAARVNPFLGLERLMTAMYVPSVTALSSFTLPEPAEGAGLLLVSPRTGATPESTRALLHWVWRGGRLFVTPADTLSGEDDPLLAHFGVTLRTDRSGDDLVCMAADPGAEAVEVLLHASPRLVDGKKAALHMAGTTTGKAGAALLRFTHGNGAVTVLADASFLSNRRIGQEAHARFALDLFDFDTKTQSLLIVFRDEVPPLIVLLARSAPQALLGLSLLLAFWLWSRGARFGPVVADPELHRRSLLEHLSAAGEFLFKKGLSQDLVEASRQAVFARLATREPAWTKLPQKELVRHLAGRARLPIGRVDRSLYGQPPRLPAEFVETVRTLSTIRRSL